MGVHFLCTDDSKNAAATVSTAAEDAEDEKGQVMPFVSFSFIQFAEMRLN